MAIFAILTIFIGWLWTPLYFLGLILTVWCIYFFRNPNRVTPTLSGVNKNNLIIAPADGKIIEISDVTPNDEIGLPSGEWQRVCIFMNVFDVHVNRSPMLGKITFKNYIPGLFFNASLDKASMHNERLILGMDAENGKKIAFVQIAGLVARRIICDVDKGSLLKAGEVFGLIRFGSRVDIYFPKEVSTLVLVGQKTISGETIIGDFTKSNKSVKGQ
ncbi:phosphatidylserine decarboxylase family protein [Alphaproteobacteria bacterium]|nr:phosphatidylserine decarboxylase family protein [Alphaproteobacteria bacterium]